MNCAEFESTLADYIDRTLDDSGRAAVEQHALSCPTCREFMSAVTGVMPFLERVEEVEAPPTLVTRIAQHVPVGRTRDPFERQGLLSKITSQWLRPILQPRLVMGISMTILSFAMLDRCTGHPVEHLQAADLNPLRIWGGVEERAVRLKDRVMKNYENLRVVYEIETRLKDMEQQETAQDQPSAARKSGQSAISRGNQPDNAGHPPQSRNKK